MSPRSALASATGSPKVRYYRTWSDGQTRTHLEGLSDYTLCGFDTSGDDSIHDKDPEKLPEGRHRVTCPDCLEIMSIVDAHRRRVPKSENH